MKKAFLNIKDRAIDMNAIIKQIEEAQRSERDKKNLYNYKEVKHWYKFLKTEGDRDSILSDKDQIKIKDTSLNTLKHLMKQLMLSSEYQMIFQSLQLKKQKIEQEAVNLDLQTDA